MPMSSCQGHNAMRKPPHWRPRPVHRRRQAPLRSCSNENRDRYSRSAQETQPEATGTLRTRAARPKIRPHQRAQKGWAKARQIETKPSTEMKHELNAKSAAPD
jgi:hypothetical protein